MRILSILTKKYSFGIIKRKVELATRCPVQMFECALETIHTSWHLITKRPGGYQMRFGNSLMCRENLWFCSALQGRRKQLGSLVELGDPGPLEYTGNYIIYRIYLHQCRHQQTTTHIIYIDAEFINKNKLFSYIILFFSNISTCIIIGNTFMSI